MSACQATAGEDRRWGVGGGGVDGAAASTAAPRLVPSLGRRAVCFFGVFLAAFCVFFVRSPRPPVCAAALTSTTGLVEGEKQNNTGKSTDADGGLLPTGDVRTASHADGRPCRGAS